MPESSKVVPTGPTIRSQAKTKRANQGGGDHRQVEKAALASPLTVPWPNIPRHLQRTLLHALPQIVPSEVADYHVSRQRCHRTEKRHRANEALRAKKALAVGHAPLSESEKEMGASKHVESKAASKTGVKRSGSPAPADRPAKKAKSAVSPPAPSKDRPTPPEILSHLVLGINEIIKSLERQIGELKTRIMIMGDALNGQMKNPTGSSLGAAAAAAMPGLEGGLLPTAPMDVDLSAPSASLSFALQDSLPSGPSDSKRKAGNTPAGNAAIMWIFIPLASISPQTLVTPIPQYCATYNTLVFQYTHLAKICQTRIPSSSLHDVLGNPPEEVRVVPMARVEAEMAELVGLRRLACLGVRASHPAVQVLHGLLPKSILHPPRLSLTLPLPTSSLHIYNSITTANPLPAKDPAVLDEPPSESSKANNPAPKEKKLSVQAVAPATSAAAGGGGTGPFIHYAPLHVKGITTTIPADANARKAKRMEEVRAKRRDAKEQKRLGKMGKKEAKKARESALAIAV